MPTLATGSRTQLIFAPEASFATLAGSPAFSFLRWTDESLEYVQANLQSAEIRSDRQIADFRLGVANVSGDIGMELIYGVIDPFLAAFLGGQWTIPLPPAVQAVILGSTVAGSLTGQNYDIYVSVVNANGESGLTKVATAHAVPDNSELTVQLPAQNIQDGSVAATKFRVWVAATGAALSAVWLQNSTGTNVGTTFTLSSLLTSGTAASTITATPATLQNGIREDSFGFEVGHLDIAQYGLALGQIIEKLNIEIKPNGIVKVKMTVLGKVLSWSGSTAATSTIAAATNSPMDSFSGVLTEGGSAFAIGTGLTLDFSNDDTPPEVLGSKTMIGAPFAGRLDLKGTLTAYMTDAALLNKWINGTESSLTITLNGNPSNRTLEINLPRLIYTKGSAPTSNEKGITQTFPFQALLSSSAGYAIQCTRSNV